MVDHPTDIRPTFVGAAGGTVKVQPAPHRQAGG